MLETGETRHMVEWAAYQKIKAAELSAQTSQVTEHDDPLTLQRKAQERARAMNASRRRRPRF